MRRVEREIDREQRRRLQFDAAAPALARLGEHRPTDARLRADAVDMGADRARAVRISRAQANSIRGATSAALQRASRSAMTVVTAPSKSPRRVGRAAPDMALVEMGMRVDEQRQDDPAGERQARRLAEVERARRRDRRDAAACRSTRSTLTNPSRSVGACEIDVCSRNTRAPTSAQRGALAIRNTKLRSPVCARCRASDAADR